MEPEFACGSELGLALLSAYFHRTVVVVTPSIIWKVAVGSPDQPPLFLPLMNKHYDPMQQQPTMAMHDAIRGAQLAATDHLKLEVGGSVPVSPSFVTWNLSAYEPHVNEAEAFSESVLALQNTLARRNRALESVPETRASVSSGALPVLSGKLFRAWRAAKALVPGVALVCPAKYDAVPMAPVTTQGRSLWSADIQQQVTTLLNTPIKLTLPGCSGNILFIVRSRLNLSIPLPRLWLMLGTPLEPIKLALLSKGKRALEWPVCSC